MKRYSLAVIIFLAFFVLGIGYSYASDRAEVLPRSLSGEVEVTLMGREAYPTTSQTKGYNVDVHQVVVNGDLLQHNGIGLVEYEMSPVSYSGLAKEWFTVDMTLFPGAKQNAFLIMQSSDTVTPIYRYKITLNAAAQKVIVEEFKDIAVIKRWEFPYNIRPNRTYEVGIGNYGFSINEIKVVGLAGVSTSRVLFKAFSEIGFNNIQPAYHLKVFAGTYGAKARFYRERLWRWPN